MIVCVCHGVSKEKITELITQGASSVRELSNSCGACSDCGTCARKISRIVDEELGKKKNSALHTKSYAD